MHRTRSVNLPAPGDLEVFLVVLREESFARAAERLGMSTAFVSKRIALLEQALGHRLLERSSRRMTLTDQGRIVALNAERILATYGSMRDDIGDETDAPDGCLIVTASAALGRTYIAPMIALLTENAPNLRIRLDIVDRRIDLTRDEVDVDIRIGAEALAHEIVHPLVPGTRILCAAPAYRDQHGLPAALDELDRHACLLICEREGQFGRWVLRNGSDTRVLDIDGRLASNDGEVVRRWALGGNGIMLRSYWDVHAPLLAGDLVRVLPQWTQAADIVAVTRQRRRSSRRIAFAIDHIRALSRTGGLAIPTPPPT